MKHTDPDTEAAFPPRVSHQARKGIAAILVLLAVVASAAAGAYHLGTKTGRGEAYVEGYQIGRVDREQELGKVLTAIEGTLAPQVIPDDADCEILTMISARAGMLAGLQAVAYAVNLPQ